MPPDEPSDHALGRSRGGFGTKIHLVTDSHGIPLGAVLSPGQDHDSRYARPALHSVRIKRPGAGRPVTRPKAVAGDKGYSFTPVREYLTMRRITAIIPTRSNQRRIPGFCKRRYRKRNAVERCIGWLKWSRRIETRHEKLAINYLAMTKLAMIKRCARLAV
jgi:transposase